MAGGKLDFEKTYKLILKDYREGRIGAVTLDWPEDFTTDEENTGADDD